MKIGLVCPYDIFRGGGVQEHVLAQAHELRKRGHTVLIITPRPRKYTNDAPKNTIFIGSSAPVRTPISTSLELGMSFVRDSIDEMLSKEKFDILHVHEPEVPVLGSQIIAKAECPIIATFHAIHPDTPLAKTIEVLRVPYSKSIYSKLNVITAVSDIAAGFVRDQTNRSVNIIPNGIDFEKYHSIKKKVTSMKSILYIGRLEKRKGVRYLLKAFSQLVMRHKDISLDIIGDGPEKELLQQFVKNKKIPNVRFHGYLQEAEKIKALQRADVFCSPALYGESFGIVLLEAMAAGAVVLAGNNPGYSAVLKHQASVSLINPKLTSEFSKKLETLLFDEQLRTEWLHWSSKFVKQFNYVDITDSYEMLYKKILSK